MEMEMNEQSGNSGQLAPDALGYALGRLDQEAPKRVWLQVDTTGNTMSAAPNIPWEERAIGADEVGQLLGLAARTVLETVACRPGFPVRLTMRPATWVAGEVKEWRDRNRVGLPKGRQK
ncbi:hypothetical protein WMO33_11925 [Xanthomonas oryzae pv. oryzicola]|nr:hypothetical protein [Xanthomonas oryzae]AKK64270.1 hypothetical protein FE36_10745 [Xanthomonas oryzae pv. oryzicola]AKO00642.1 hypothetical protein ACU15_09115 [Xanthomonas oryzae pv. oryzicola]AKO04393.1 hypothetical protein ACU16_09760 [Xanthomonas oryzae pv. oryzicola]AKO08281.1 hypothetical protein ACU17_09615 [Xanthomonas oryzae pv. oryzicola]KOR49813.1 hypothetical protein ADT27_04790 [Xanthomonas oryzae]